VLLQTHLIAGQTAFLTACILTGHAPAPVEMWASMAAAAIPDLDKRSGYIGRLVWPLAEWLEYRFGHRTVTHSLLLQALAGGGLYPFLPFGFWLALVCGWISHSWLDMATPSGVCWFWPSRARCIFPGNADLRITETSWPELIFAVIVGLAAFPLAYWASQGTGATGLIRDAFGNIVSARQEYDSAKGGHAWTLEVEGRDNRTFAAIQGIYSVRGPWQEGGFILEGEAGPVTVCLSQGCDWHPERAVLTRGEPQETTALNLMPKATTGPALAQRLESLAEVGAVYVLGQVETRAGKPQPPTITGSETSLQLHYATPADIAGIGAILSGEITIQVRHKPSVRVPEIGEEPEQATSRHPLLDKWISLDL
jgi:inner membrane protein